MRFYKVLDGSDPFSVGTLLAANGQELAHGAAAATDTWLHSMEFGGHAAEFKVTGFSGGGGGGATGGSPLPVELSQFTGTTKTRSNMLIWTTESERNSSYFEVQRSVSGSIGYEAIGRVDARGNSSVLVDYSFEDESPSNLTYYRLKMVDMDGSYEYSNVISLVRDGKGFGLLGAYPVPTSAELTVAFNTDESSNMTLVLTDITGRIVLTDKFVSTSGIQKHHVDMTSLVLGTYFVKLSNGQQTLVQRVVKQ